MAGRRPTTRAGGWHQHINGQWHYAEDRERMLEFGWCYNTYRRTYTKVEPQIWRPNNSNSNGGSDSDSDSEMRMWNCDVQIMCDEHLLGEHVETHMFVGTIRRGTSLSGYLRGRLLEVHTLNERHDLLAEEMGRRGYVHSSPLPRVQLPEGYTKLGDIGDSGLRELLRRCERCRLRWIHKRTLELAGIPVPPGPLRKYEMIMPKILKEQGGTGS